MTEFEWPDAPDPGPSERRYESQRRALAEAIKDVCWRATQYGETEDGDTFAYLVTKGAMHRLIGAAQCAGISASFRANSGEVAEDLGVDPVEHARVVKALARVEALADLYDSWDGTRPHPGESSPHQRAQLRAALASEGTT